MNLQFHPNPSPSKFGKRVSVLIGKDISLRKAHHPSTFPAGKKTRSFQPRFPWLVHPQKSRRHAGDGNLPSKCRVHWHTKLLNENHNVHHMNTWNLKITPKLKSPKSVNTSKHQEKIISTKDLRFRLFVWRLCVPVTRAHDPHWCWPAQQCKRKRPFHFKKTWFYIPSTKSQPARGTYKPTETESCVFSDFPWVIFVRKGVCKNTLV